MISYRYVSLSCSMLCSSFLGFLALQAESEELKKQIEELSARLSSITAEKNKLQNRNNLLEKVVQVRSTGGDSASAQVCPQLAWLWNIPIPIPAAQWGLRGLTNISVGSGA